jgi:hypothetical protein
VDNERKKRLTVEVESKTHQELKSRLAKDGKSITAWLLEIIGKFLRGEP